MSKQKTRKQSSTAGPVPRMRYARICPNTNGWMSPSGGVKYTGQGFPAVYGFGFDEWLRGTPVIESGAFKGRAAGFIQGFNMRGLDAGFVTDVSLFWLDGNRPRNAYTAIEIKHCKKLSDQDALAIGREYKRAGFFNQMNRHLVGLGLRPPVIADPLDVLNVVFSPDAIQLVQPNTLSPVSGHRYSNLYHP